MLFRQKEKSKQSHFDRRRRCSGWPWPRSSRLTLAMNSARNVGEIFKKAGESYSKLGDMVLLLHPAAAELAKMEASAGRKVETTANASGTTGDLLPDVSSVLNTSVTAKKA